MAFQPVRTDQLSPLTPMHTAKTAIGHEFASVADFEKHAAGILGPCDDGTATYASFNYKTYTALVCSTWKSLRCPAGVAAEAITGSPHGWVIRVVELEHSERCKLVRAVAQTPNEYVAANSSKVISPPEISASGASRSSSPEAPLSASLKVSMESNKQPAFHRLSTTSGLRVKLVQRDSGLSTAPSSPIRSPVPKSRSSASSQSTTSVATPTSPPQLDDTFPSLETFHAHTKKWINANFPQYFIYFRSRKGDRPEFYCKYQNSPGATTTPGLGCKFGFNAKRKVSSDGTELYVVTKSVSYHIPECLRKTGQDAQEAGGSDVADKKRKNSVIQESVYRDDRHDDNNKRFKA